MKIPDDKIDEIRSATDIIDLVGGFVRLKKRGKNHLGLCPFHTEKTPSFNVSASRQMYHCFGCGAGGNVFTFLMAMEKISFVEAVRSLAKAAGIELPAPGTQGETGVPTELDRAHALCTLAAQHFHRNLVESQEGKLALEYLKHRGISDAMITQFGLGYALNSWDAFLECSREQGYAPEFVEKYGLARKREDGGFYDYFRGRVIFPVFTASGRVVGFGARKLREDDPLGKYINSPESPVYNKSRILYGLSQSKEAIREADSALLVEGYLDLISVYQAGVKNVIASSGTALASDQIQLVRRYTKNITIVYDADSAGSKAAMRGVDLVLEQDMDVKVAMLPPGEDPDSFVRASGAAGLGKLIDGALSFIDFIIQARKERDASPEERSKTVRLLVQTVARMPDALKRDLYVKHIAGKYALRESVLQSELTAALKGAAAAPQHKFRSSAAAAEGADVPPTAPAHRDGPVPADERDLFAAVLRGGGDVARFMLAHIAPVEFSHRVTRALAAAISARLEEGESIDPAALIDATEEADGRAFISEIMLTKYELNRGPRPGTRSIEQGEPLRIASDTLLAIKKRSLRSLKRENQEHLKRMSATGGDVVPFLRKNTELDEELARLEKEGLPG